MTRSQVRVLSRPPVLSHKWTTKLSMVSKFGLVAQLVEHRLCKAGVSGSIPLESTIQNLKKCGVCWTKSELFLTKIRTANFDCRAKLGNQVFCSKKVRGGRSVIATL